MRTKEDILMIIEVDKSLYKKLSEAEMKVVDYINMNADKISIMSITTIADKTFTSIATVSRTIQKCGFRGISELRYKLSKTDENKNSIESPYAVNNILSKSFREATETIDNISITSIFKTIEYMKSAKRILIYARGFTGLVAEEFQMYLQLLGYNAVIVKDVMWMNNTDKIVTKEDVVFILSLRNSTKELSESACTAKRKGAKVITCCCISPSDLEKYSDICIVGHTEQITQTSGQTVYSRVPLSIITRTIIEYIAL